MISIPGITIGVLYSDHPCFKFELPWPPSINHYWRHTKNGHYISKEGKLYRDEVYYTCLDYRGILPENGRFSVVIEAYPPDKRKRDLDNLLKSLLDALQNSGVYTDDSQIDRLTIERKTPLNEEFKGRLIVEIKTIS